MNLNWLVPFFLCTFTKIDPNESCALLKLPPELFLIIMETFGPPSIPMVMFTCKLAFRNCNQLRMFQRYLVWKYQIPELLEISCRPQFNYLRKKSQLMRPFDPEDANDRRRPEQLQSDVQRIKCTNPVIFDELILLLLRLYWEEGRPLVEEKWTDAVAAAVSRSQGWNDFFKGVGDSLPDAKDMSENYSR